MSIDVRKIAAWIPVSHEIWREVDEARNPWRYPDPPPNMHIEPFPRLAILAAIARRVRGRARDALHVLRNGLPEDAL